MPKLIGVRQPEFDRADPHHATAFLHDQNPELTISGNKTTKKIDTVVSSLTFGCE